jgi:NAD(P)H-dependent FMN reductase
MTALRVLVISGSERSGSFNRQLSAQVAALARAAGATAEAFNLRDLALPVYDGDLEQAQGVPASTGRLRDALAGSDALLLVTPEYNGFPPPLVLNSFDWLSRLPAQGTALAGLAATAGKPAGLLSASPGPLGGLRSLNFTRQYLSMAFSMMPVPQQFALGRAGEAFDPAGSLKDPKQLASVQTVVAAVLKVAAALKAA